MSLSDVSLLDPFILIMCGFLLYKNARLTLGHPGCMFLIFHGMFVTARLYSVMSGSPTLFSDWPGKLPISEQEIARAALFADIALISMTIGLIISSRRNSGSTARSAVLGVSPRVLLSERTVRTVSAVAFPIGILALLINGVVPSAEKLSVDFGAWSTSSWRMVTQFWPVLALLALIYFYGFRRSLMIPLSVLLALMAIQGFNRFRVVLPAIFLLITWQSRTGHKWPRKWMFVSLVCLSLLVFPMKKLGWMIQGGESSLSDIIYVFSDSFSEVVRGRSQDQWFLDQLASTLWLVDESGQYSYGRMYSAFLFLPIPRQLWPDKPILSWYWAEISSPSRPMYETGMAPTLVGEAYLNFGLIGVVAVPFLFSYWMGTFYFVAMRHSHFSVCRFIYVTEACCLIQILRDGVSSVVLMPVVNMMPLVAIAVLSYIAWRRSQRRILLAAQFVTSQGRGDARA